MSKKKNQKGLVLSPVTKNQILRLKQFYSVDRATDRYPDKWSDKRFLEWLINREFISVTEPKLPLE